MTTQTNAAKAIAGKFTHKLEGKFEFIYLMNCTAYYASVLTPKKKFESPAADAKNQSENQYEITVFFDKDVRDVLEAHTDDGGAFLNKTIFEVGVDKNKKRKIKFPAGEGELYAPMKGLHGVQFSQNEFTNQGKPAVMTVVDAKGKTWPEDKLIGNGSKVHVKLFGYRNREGMLVVSLNTVVVVDHVEYTGGGGAEQVDDVFGFAIEAPAKPEKKANPVDEFGDFEEAPSDKFVEEDDDGDKIY